MIEKILDLFFKARRIEKRKADLKAKLHYAMNQNRLDH